MRSLNTNRMPLTPWRDSIHRRVSSALTRMPNPLRAVTGQSDSFVQEAMQAGYLELRGDAFFLAPRAVGLWFFVNRRPRHAAAPDADRRRDLVTYDEVLREMGPEIANREARPPIEHRRQVEAAVARIFADIGYVPDTGRAG